MTKTPASKQNKEPRPHEVHRFEYAADRTLGIFTHVVKKAIVIIVIIILLCLLTIAFLAK